MPVPSSINDLSTTAALNSPAGSESPATTDDYLRAHAAFIAGLRDGGTSAVTLTGDQTVAGVKTFTSTPVVPNDSFAFAKLQNIATARVLGRSTAGSGDIEELATLPAVNGAAVTALNASALASGTVPTARLGSGTANSTTFLRGDQTYAPAGLLAASTAQAQAGTLDTVAITPLKMREGLNASGTAPVYACRAWVNFNGTGTVAIRASGNVSSITDNGVGAFTVNFTTAMPDANYCVSVNMATNNHGHGASVSSSTNTGAPITQTTSAVSIFSTSDAGNQVDPSHIYVAIFG